ncbi:MAG: 3-mercaptopyruvate sulfurtransferase [Planktomarina sp.]|nr:3-mercaptopyruvate sulfurtransferase [Planktomarina sp.]MDT2083295.1 3-mercaptopyruvate sulfurtransferase [Planktomarina sp.]
MKDDPNTLVSTEWLKANQQDPIVRIIDASWHMPSDGRDASNEFVNGHILNARFFDIDDISDHRSTLPHMVPPVEKFMSRVRALGVGDGHQIIVYDTKGLFSAARVWWLFRLMGHNSVAVLDGGLPKWIADGNPLSTTAPIIRDRHMTVKQQLQMVRDVTQVAHASKLNDHEIIDARSGTRFIGEAPEPRTGLRSGHIPNSKNLPFTKVLNTDHTMKTVPELTKVFKNAGIDLNKPAITTCGSGITAAVLSLALQRVGKTDHALYDGSWTEWGQFPTLNIATGDN